MVMGYPVLSRVMRKLILIFPCDKTAGWKAREKIRLLLNDLSRDLRLYSCPLNLASCPNYIFSCLLDQICSVVVCQWWKGMKSKYTWSIYICWVWMQHSFMLLLDKFLTWYAAYSFEFTDWFLNGISIMFLVFGTVVATDILDSQGCHQTSAGVKACYMWSIEMECLQHNKTVSIRILDTVLD